MRHYATAPQIRSIPSLQRARLAVSVASSSIVSVKFSDLLLERQRMTTELASLSKRRKHRFNADASEDMTALSTLVLKRNTRRPSTRVGARWERNV